MEKAKPQITMWHWNPTDQQFTNQENIPSEEWWTEKKSTKTWHAVKQAKLSRLQDFSDSQYKVWRAGTGEVWPAVLAAEHFTLHKRANHIVMVKCNAIMGEAVHTRVGARAGCPSSPLWRTRLHVFSLIPKPVDFFLLSQVKRWQLLLF